MLAYNVAIGSAYIEQVLGEGRREQVPRVVSVKVFLGYIIHIPKHKYFISAM